MNLRHEAVMSRVEVLPGFAHTVAGTVESTLAGRDMDQGLIKWLARECTLAQFEVVQDPRIARKGRKASWLATWRRQTGIIEAFRRQAEELGQFNADAERSGRR